MIVLFTDFGFRGPYVGQMQAVIAQQLPDIPIICLFDDAPRFDPRASAYLLAAYVSEFPPGTVFLCVVDPGVGSDSRKPVVCKVDGRWFVGPGNGLFDVIAQRGVESIWWEITWQPDKLSSSFHGRDLFAPVAAMLARGESPPGKLIENPEFSAEPDDWQYIIYIDGFGNAMTGIRADGISSGTKFKVGDQILGRADTFADVPVGQAFWYENANGLVEIAVNQGQAVDVLDIKLGDDVFMVDP